MSHYLQPLNQRDLLARSLAKTFHEEARFPQYQRLCRQYPLSVLSKAFTHAKRYPYAQPQQARAIFLFLLKRYARQATRHSRS